MEMSLTIASDAKDGEDIFMVASSALRERLPEAFENPECTVYKDAAYRRAEGNSTVLASPVIDVLQTLGAVRQVQGAVNFVSIRGFSGEPLHFHTAHLIGVIVRGTGKLLTSNNGSPQGVVKEAQVSAGDVVIIPRGAYHFFECDPSDELDYIALEFSDKAIDYQKHWKTPD